MQFVYKIPGYILCLLAGFCLSFGGPLIREFEGASPWQILFWRSLFFILAIVIFLLLTYKKQAFDILKKGGNISAVFRKDLPRKFWLCLQCFFEAPNPCISKIFFLFSQVMFFARDQEISQFSHVQVLDWIKDTI